MEVAAVPPFRASVHGFTRARPVMAVAPYGSACATDGSSVERPGPDALAAAAAAAAGALPVAPAAAAEPRALRERRARSLLPLPGGSPLQ